MSEQERPKVIGAPDEIWLIHGDIASDAKHDECFDVTWCEEQQFDADVRYVRADKFDQQAAELAAFREENHDLETEITHYEKELKKVKAELAKLRGFATRVLSPYVRGEIFRPVAKLFGLIDETGRPTALLTGESK